MDEDAKHEGTGNEDSASAESLRPSPGGGDGQDEVRDQLDELDDWEGLDEPELDPVDGASIDTSGGGSDDDGQPLVEDASEPHPDQAGDWIGDDDTASSQEVTGSQIAEPEPSPHDGSSDALTPNGPSTANGDSPSPTPPLANSAVTPRREPEPIGAAPEDFALEMRQVAGLTAGSSMKLPPGKTFQFNETTGPTGGDHDSSPSFVLKVTDEGRVIVIPGTATAIVNETVVDEPTFVGNGILSVGSACFAVRPTRNPSKTAALERAEAAIHAPRAIEVGDPGDDGENLFDSIGQTRHLVAERHRLTHPDPEELKSRLVLMDPGLWERGRTHRFFGRYSVGYAIIPWQPKFDDPSRIPDELHSPIATMSVLPWVPITASLTQGPIAIHGKRAATLAACRHAVLSLAALTAPGDIRFSVVTGRQQVEDWQWTKSLPELMSPSRGNNGHDEPLEHYQLSVVDGSAHLEPAGLSIADAGPDYGIIVLGANRSSVPDGCATYIAAGDDGTALVTNHLGEEILATPIGVTEAFAHDMATRIADILIGYD